MNISVTRPDQNEIDKIGVNSWPIWECRPSVFDWHYDSTEVCYIIAGEVTITADGEDILLKPGDMVRFPKGLDCVWDVSKAIKKHYRFE